MKNQPRPPDGEVSSTTKRRTRPRFTEFHVDEGEERVEDVVELGEDEKFRARRGESTNVLGVEKGEAREVVDAPSVERQEVEVEG